MTQGLTQTFDAFLSFSQCESTIHDLWWKKSCFPRRFSEVRVGLKGFKSNTAGIKVLLLTRVRYKDHQRWGYSTVERFAKKLNKDKRKGTKKKLYFDMGRIVKR